MDVAQLAAVGVEVKQIAVAINYDIIKLFSEGLYRSPHKAIEELVSNSYDAGARKVHVILREQNDENVGDHDPLWVIDDGCGMDAKGFEQLWVVAQSQKGDKEQHKRLPIGQFGIGKLAAYVLAWELTHVSCVNGKFLLTVMDFKNNVTDRNTNANPVHVSLRELTEEDAKGYLAEIKHWDPGAWSIMFGQENRDRTWTAAALSNFKDLYRKVSTGRLEWVLSTGLPLSTDFQVFLNKKRIESSKEKLQTIKSIEIDEDRPGVGRVRGNARIFEKRLTTGKSSQVGRSNGFFIRVRERVINIEDELFGIAQPNHAAWSRFSLDVNVDGLRGHLLSSREGVRDSDDIQDFRGFLQSMFNDCRQAYDEWNRKENDQLDRSALLNDSSVYITEPLSRSVRNAAEAGAESFYVKMPRGVTAESRMKWLDDYDQAIIDRPFNDTEFTEAGHNFPVARYDPNTRNVSVNSEHPFVDKLTKAGSKGGRNFNPAKLFAWSEVLLEGQLQEHGISNASIASFLADRDKVLRLTSGDSPPTAKEVLRRLEAASHHYKALERAVGSAFVVLGFNYERRDDGPHGTDGVIYARLGQHQTRADYKVVYDAKSTIGQSVRAEKVDIARLERFRKEEVADFGFHVAIAYQGEKDEGSALNQEARTHTHPLTLLKVDHLHRLVHLHCRHGVTLTKLRSLFEGTRTVLDVEKWLEDYETELTQQGEVPLSELLSALDAAKRDRNAKPNVHFIRAKNADLERFRPERLTARLKAVECIVGSRWIEVDRDSQYVLMHQTAEKILEELDRNIGEWPTQDREGRV